MKEIKLKTPKDYKGFIVVSVPDTFNHRQMCSIAESANEAMKSNKILVVSRNIKVKWVGPPKIVLDK